MNYHPFHSLVGVNGLNATFTIYQNTIEVSEDAETYGIV